MMILGDNDNLRDAFLRIAEKRLCVKITTDGQNWFVHLVQNDLNKPDYNSSTMISRDEDLSFALNEILQ